MDARMGGNREREYLGPENLSLSQFTRAHRHPHRLMTHTSPVFCAFPTPLFHGMPLSYIGCSPKVTFKAQQCLSCNYINYAQLISRNNSNPEIESLVHRDPTVFVSLPCYTGSRNVHLSHSPVSLI